MSFGPPFFIDTTRARTKLKNLSLLTSAQVKSCDQAEAAEDFKPLAELIAQLVAGHLVKALDNTDPNTSPRNSAYKAAQAAQENNVTKMRPIGRRCCAGSFRSLPLDWRFQGTLDYKSISINFDRLDTGNLGIKVNYQNDVSFSIKDVVAGGSIEKWNAENPETQLLPGDRITAVNGHESNLLEHLKSEPLCSMKVERAKSADAIYDSEVTDSNKQDEASEPPSRAPSCPPNPQWPTLHRSESFGNQSYISIATSADSIARMNVGLWSDTVVKMGKCRMEHEDRMLNNLMPKILSHSEEWKEQKSDTASSDIGDSADNAAPNDQCLTSPLALRMCGLLPWKRHCMEGYLAPVRCVVFLLSALVALLFIQSSFHARTGTLRFSKLCNFVLGLGCCIGLLAFSDTDNRRILDTIVKFAQRHGFQNQWMRSVRRYRMLLSAYWACAVLLQIPEFWCDEPLQAALSAAAYALISAVFTSFAYAILHVSCALATMVEIYCANYTLGQDIRVSVYEWNMLQAVLRKASGTMQKGFVVLQTTALLLLLLGLSSLLIGGGAAGETAATPCELGWMLSVGLIILTAAQVFFKAAQVTEKCNQVPSLINSLCVNCTDQWTHFLTEYITYSATGFYVAETRLTAVSAWKLVYMIFVATFSVLTKTYLA